MKRIVLLVLCCMVFSAGVCNAEIFRSNDQFTGGKIIRTNFYGDESIKHKLEWISFYKVVASNLLNYGIEVHVETFKDFGLSVQPAQLNIDGDFMIDVLMRKRQEMSVSGSYFYALEYQVPQEIVDKIKTANRVALKFTQNNGNQFVYVLPDEVLAEWKQVIYMEE